MKDKYTIFGFVVLALIIIGLIYSLYLNNKKQIGMDNIENTKVVMQTNVGDITLEIFENMVPATADNFLKLSSEGFYDGVRFHRVIKDFMIQGGDPLSKDINNRAVWGTGGPGYQFADEITPSNRNDKWTISMANAGPNTNGSQFFINVADNNFLDTKHTVFGRVVDGEDVVEKISLVDTDQRDAPIEDVIIEKINIK